MLTCALLTQRRAFQGRVRLQVPFYDSGLAPALPATECVVWICSDRGVQVQPCELGAEDDFGPGHPPPPPPPLATDNLFENADGVLHHCSIGAAACYLLFMLTRAIMPLLLHQAGDLRQAQLSALALENVGFSTAIDTSDWLNIHPPDKQTVSSRPVWHLCRITHFRPVNLLGGADGLLRPTSKRGRSNPSMR